MNFTSKVSFQLLKVVFLTREGLAGKTWFPNKHVFTFGSKTVNFASCT